MEVSSTIILYSRFSPACTQFLQLLDQIPLEGRTIFKFQPLCIDSTKVRNIIQKSNIKSVPFVSIIYTNGQRETFEGDLAFVWVTDVINRLRSKPALTTPIEEEPKAQPQQQPEIDTSNNETIKTLEAKIAQMEKLLLETRQPEEYVEPVKVAPKKKAPMGQTSLEDFPEISELEGEGDLISEDIDLEMEFRSSDRPPTSAIQRKQENLHNTAAEMQKEREMSEEQFNKRRLYS